MREEYKAIIDAGLTVQLDDPSLAESWDQINPGPSLDRIVRFAELVGRENVIASTDCGLGGRVHPQIAFAKLEALGEGARRASKRLW
jgi:methionine synthase II (cobalamin-independent)